MTTGRINQVAFVADNQAQTTPLAWRARCHLSYKFNGIPFFPTSHLTQVIRPNFHTTHGGKDICPTWLAEHLSFPTSSLQVAFFTVRLSFALFQLHPRKLPSRSLAKFTLFQRHPPKLPCSQFGLVHSFPTSSPQVSLFVVRSSSLFSSIIPPSCLVRSLA